MVGEGNRCLAMKLHQLAMTKKSKRILKKKKKKKKNNNNNQLSVELMSLQYLYLEYLICPSTSCTTQICPSISILLEYNGYAFSLMHGSLIF
ncbi:hypothetical protein GQ55_9G227700 [Panicum hallii var. hallii]|uniref:Uncharacterized protein n=1 Tax=Panicum hallii var. hallii TaxID=1504633 RepID=A0A2T7C6H0_9POAL|nr:hypothetical protein GQ55_9G227700 [Panicum hallii var. hallii]